MAKSTLKNNINKPRLDGTEPRPRRGRPPKQSPIAPPVSGELVREVLPKNDDDSKLFKSLYDRIQDAQTVRGTWNQKMDYYYRMRMRIRKEKNFPFVGCSNLRLPTIEKYIRKIKAALFNVVWGIKPHAMVISEPNTNPEAAWKLETYMDWLLDTKIRFPKKLSILIDKMLEKGFCVAEPIWKMADEKRQFEIDLADIPREMLVQVFSLVDDESLVESIAKLFSVDMSESVRYENTKALTEAIGKLRTGERKVKLTLADETYNNVEINIHDPENVYVPVDSGINPQDARFVAYEVYEPWDVVRQKAKSGVYDKAVVDEMEAYSQVPVDQPPSQGNSSFNNMFRTSQVTEDMREGISRINNPSRLVKLWRVYAWYDLDDDGMEERNVFILAPEWKRTLSKFPFTYSHKKWPCIRFDSEVVDDKWYSPRGVPEMLEDIDKEINAQHNQKIDQQTIRNTPMFAFRSGIINPRLVKFIPGQGIPVNGMTPLNDAISVLNNTNSNAEFSYRDEEMLLKSEIQELYGQVDYSLQSQINRREPRTASEATQAQQSANLVFSLDSTLFGESMSELFGQIVGLTQQYLQDSVYFQVVGEGQTVHLTREEIQGEFQVRIRGNDVNTNGARRLEMAQAKIQMLANPYSIQSGMYTPVNHYYALKEYLQETGDVFWDKKISVPQPPPPPSPPPAITNIKTNFAELSPTEKAQVLVSAGIKPDLQAHIMDKQLEVVAEMTEPKPAKEPSGK